MRLEPVLGARESACVFVYGATNSTLAGALAAGKLRMRVANVEAGMRSYERATAEEVNRVLRDHVSDLPFCNSSYTEYRPYSYCCELHLGVFTEFVTSATSNLADPR